MILNCAIIDDEPLAADLLASYARKTPFLHLIGSYNSAVSAMKEIRTNHIDLVFLDIQMPELSGLEFAKIFSKDTKVIFTTAFSQYAVEGYKVNALDYLLKPISYEEFFASASKALEWFEAATQNEMSLNDRFMYVKSDYKLVQIKLDDILFIEGVKDYVRIYLENSPTPVMSLMNMKRLEEFLPQPEFMRTHRSYIVHMPKARLIDRFRIVFGEHMIPISESNKEAVQHYFDSHTLT